MSVEFGDPRLPERFWAKVEIQDDGCWAWTATKIPDGYGQYAIATKTMKLAHRVAYNELVAPIPAGLIIDHVCHDPNVCHLGKACPHRACVNPAHMQAVTQKENSSPERRFDPNAAMTECIHGHSLEDAYICSRKDGGKFRVCRVCAKDANTRNYRRRTMKKEVSV